MDGRMRKMLMKLAESNRPVTSKELATELQVSTKTIQNNMKSIHELIPPDVAEVVSYRGKGYQLHILNQQSFKQHLNDSDYIHECETFQDRVHYIMERLLMTCDYIKLEALADELFVTRSALKNEFKEVRRILDKYNLSLETKPYYGTKIVGSEFNIRYCISEYIFNQKSDLIEHDEEWVEIISFEKLSEIKEVVLGKLRINRIYISDISLQNLITHIAISCKRIEDGYSISDSVKTIDGDILKSKEYLVALDIIHELGNRFSIIFSEEEVLYLTMHMQGTKLVNPVAESDALKEVIDQEIDRLVSCLLEHINNKYGLDFLSDEDLVKGLALHLKPAINRYRYQMNIRNPMLEDIKGQYPFSFEIALSCSKVIKELMAVDIDENEVGYLALHIEAAQERQQYLYNHAPRCLIVCATGLGTAQLLLYKLKRELGNKLNIVGTTEYYNLFNETLTDIDLVISTISIKEKLDVPVVHVSTILGNQDVNKIETLLIDGFNTVNLYLREPYIYLRKDLKTQEDVLKYMVNDLVQHQLVNQSYLPSILEREKLSTTAFGNLVAIPHAIDPQTSETFWSLMTLEDPIQWGGKPVQLILMLHIMKANKTDLQKMYQVIMQLLNNKESVQALLRCKSKKQLQMLIRQL
ncbi:BglG family transcription antiterminator [Amphibacillus jilinensis]|uniref:BglG family transcription antiterminator n=1 Tax=Amphibacillus jilinensis TaxID=1216008 RepID=UPI0002DEEFE5|nr:BglG family transcription antiterminator [Amphibacillus jilinensis]